MSAQHHDDVVTIVVVRTGGFAGRRRQWRVNAGDDDADRWLVLVDACPWDDVPAAASEPTPTPEPTTPAPTPTTTPTPERTAPAHDAEQESGTSRSASRGADRFVWSIHARTPEHKREQKLPEPDLVGPWRTLVDAVRSAD